MVQREAQQDVQAIERENEKAAVKKQRELEKQQQRATKPLEALQENSAGASPTSAPKATSPSAGAAPAARKGGNAVQAVPQEQMPALARVLAEAGAAGVGKVIAAFRVKCPIVSKRQVTKTIQEIAVKEKQAGDRKAVWHLRPAFSHLLAAASNKRAAAPAGDDDVSPPKKLKAQ